MATPFNAVRARGRIPEDAVAAFLIPEVLLPSQVATNPERTPELRLLSAVLDDAFRRLRAQTEGGHEARQWVFSGRRGSPFTFLDICEALELDPETYRTAALQVWRKRIMVTRIMRRSMGKSDSRRIGG